MVSVYGFCADLKACKCNHSVLHSRTALKAQSLLRNIFRGNSVTTHSRFSVIYASLFKYKHWKRKWNGLDISRNKAFPTDGLKVHEFELKFYD